MRFARRAAGHFESSGTQKARRRKNVLCKIVHVKGKIRYGKKAT
jgi:hypothetical protein